jgi:Uma2 family endonuclease
MIEHLRSSDLPAEDYLKREEDSLIRHEYRRGNVYVMAEESNNHTLIVGNLSVLLKNHLRKSKCHSYSLDTKVYVEAVNSYYYPDVVASYDVLDRAFDEFLRYPCLIVEVLSSETEVFDRGDKFTDYRSLESLQEYVLISQNQMRVECFRRTSEDEWVLYSYGEADRIHLASVNFQCAVEDLYKDVDLTSAAPP